MRMLGLAVGSSVVRAAALVAVLACSISSEAVAAFDDPFFLSQSNARTPDVAFDGEGNALIVWWRDNGDYVGVEMVDRSAAGDLGHVEIISPEGREAIVPKVAMNSSGQAVIAWEMLDANLERRIQMRTRSPSGDLGPIRTISKAGGNATDPQVAINENGDAIIVWERFFGADQRIQVRGLASNGTLTSIRTVSPPGNDANPGNPSVGAQPRVVIEPSGDGYVVWVRDSVIEGRAFIAGGALGGVQTLSTGNLNGLPQMAMDGNERIIVIWSHSGVVQARTRNANGGLGTLVTSEPGNYGGFGVAVRPNGQGLIAVSRQISGVYRIEVLTATSTGEFGEPETISPAGENAFTPSIAMQPNGKAVIMWQRDGTPDRVKTRVRRSGGALEAVQTLSPAGRIPIDQTVKISDDGEALVLYSLYNSAVTTTRIQAVAGP